jgi:hypothetical protein
MVPDLVTPIVRRFFAQERLDVPPGPDTSMRREPPPLESDAFTAPPARQT